LRRGSIDWQAELDRCQALRENVTRLLQAGESEYVACSGRRAMRRGQRKETAISAKGQSQQS
jgi:hypothetical protein